MINIYGFLPTLTKYLMMIRGIKSSLVKLILAQINFAYIVSMPFVAFEKQNPVC